jgi:signal transduction histidine kinase
VRKALFLVWHLTLAGASLASTPGSPEGESTPSGATNAATLTRAVQVLELSPVQAQAHLPVDIRGVVTCYDHGMVLFVQDETGGVFVYYTGDHLLLRPGEYVEVKGVAKPGRYSPIVVPEKIQPVEKGTAISPRSVSLARIYLEGLDAQWVETIGVVRSEKLSDNRLNLEVAEPPHRVNVWIPDHGGYEHLHLLGSLVRIRGVVGAGMNDKGQPATFQLFANTLADITVLRPVPADLFSGPPSSIRDLVTYHVTQGMERSVRTHGVVTLHWPGRALFLQDSTGGLEVQPKQLDAVLAPGTVVDVAGFLGPSPARLVEDALIRKLQTNAPPQPAHVSSEDLFHGRYDNQLVEIEGFFLGRASSPSNCFALALQAGSHLITGLLDASIPQGPLTTLQVGSGVRVTGVCRPDAGLRPDPAVCLLLRSPLDVRVSGPPNSTRTLGIQALAAAAILTSLGVAGALWYIQRQRRRTEHVLQLQGVLQAEMHQGQQQLRRSLEERERIGRDLHDDIIQSIYAVGLSLEACRRVVRQAPGQAEARLAEAIHTLNNAIGSVRSFIAGLEPKVLNGREFKTALKSLALTSGDGPSQFRIDVDPAGANLLSSTQATQLLHIAKEAMSNSLRHAHASDVIVSLHPAGIGVRLEIRDDGVGFDSSVVGSTGQGLRNMAARAREIGAELQLISAPGQGCRILVTVPQRNLNESD